MCEKPKMTFYKEEKMGPNFEFEDSGAFFSMRGPFWEESREKAFAEKRASIPSEVQEEEAWETNQDVPRHQMRVPAQGF